MDDRAIWDLILNTWSALGAHYESVLERYSLEIGLPSRGWSILLAVLSFEPESTTPAHLMVRGPYTSSETYLEQLVAVTEKGLVTEVSKGQFRLTSTGREWTNNLVTDVRSVMAAVDPLPRVDSNRLSDLLEKLVASCLDNPPPPDTWSIRLSRKLMPEKDSPQPFIEQAFSCLAAYRDDSHLAAWRQSGLPATALETLTYLWRSQVHSVDNILEQLSHRGHPDQVYIDALKELRTRGLIEGSDGDLRITVDGRFFRDQVEAGTDKYFYAPWKCLNKLERQKMTHLLNRMLGGLRVS